VGIYFIITMKLGLSLEDLSMEQIFCFKVKVTLKLIRYVCCSDPFKSLLRAKSPLLTSGRGERRGGGW
jgi:hypothetical protein